MAWKKAKRARKKRPNPKGDVIGRKEGIIRQAKIRRAMKIDGFWTRINEVTRFYALLQNGQTFKLGEILSSTEIAQRVKEVATKCGIPEILTPYTKLGKRRRGKVNQAANDRYDLDKIVKLIGDMYLLNGTSKKIDGVKVHCYEFLAFNDVELADFVPIAPLQATSKPIEDAPTGLTAEKE